MPGRTGSLACVVWVGFITFLLLGSARAETSRAYQIKAAFIFNFAQFTEWPADAFESKESPLVIGIVGTNPFDEFLEDTVRNEVVQGRRVTVEYYTRVTDIKTCHILYVGVSEAKRLDMIRDQLKGKPVLTVTDLENASLRGVIIEFVTNQNRIRFRINTQAAKAVNLTLSSKLLRVADQTSR
jgi:hypothetical protein